jgi:hypothetical protein
MSMRALLLGLALALSLSGCRDQKHTVKVEETKKTQAAVDAAFDDEEAAPTTAPAPSSAPASATAAPK